MKKALEIDAQNTFLVTTLSSPCATGVYSLVLEGDTDADIVKEAIKFVEVIEVVEQDGHLGKAVALRESLRELGDALFKGSTTFEAPFVRLF